MLGRCTMALPESETWLQLHDGDVQFSCSLALHGSDVLELFAELPTLVCGTTQQSTTDLWRRNRRISNVMMWMNSKVHVAIWDNSKLSIVRDQAQPMLLVHDTIDTIDWSVMLHQQSGWDADTVHIDRNEEIEQKRSSHWTWG